jgi:hypothetical protein
MIFEKIKKKFLIKEKPRILVFLHGTCIMHRNAIELSRENIVQQVIDGVDDSIYDFATYIPIGNAVDKLITWQKHGAKIAYLSSHKSLDNVKKDEIILNRYNFPKGTIYYRKENNWNLPIEEFKPNILIEDDCESIGGEYQMTYPNLDTDKKSEIFSIVVREFGGIDHLPDDLHKLRKFGSFPK